MAGSRGMRSGRPYDRGGLDTRKKILKVSLRLFSERGFHETTVRQIGKECGITDAAIYYHFRSKRALLEELYKEAGFVEAMERLGTPDPVDSLQAYLVNAAGLTADLFVKNADLLRVTLMGVLMGDWAAGALHWEYREKWRRSFENLLLTYAKRERLQIRDVARASETLMHAVIGAFIERVAVTPRGRLRREGGKSFRDHMVSVARDLGAVWEKREVGPLRVSREGQANAENQSRST